MGKIVGIVTIAQEELMEFHKCVARRVREMQRRGLMVDIQFTTVMQRNGLALHSALIIGREKGTI